MYAAQENGRRNAATVFDSSIAEHAQRAFGGTYNLFCFTETQFPVKQKKTLTCVSVFLIVCFILHRIRNSAAHF